MFENTTMELCGHCWAKCKCRGCGVDTDCDRCEGCGVCTCCCECDGGGENDY